MGLIRPMPPDLNIVLHQPEIPSNTGNIGRTCLAAASRLHLIKPLGFSIDDRQLKRAGLDYWPEVDVRIWESLDELLAATDAERARRFFFTTKTGRPYYSARFQRGDWLFFGRETKGLPERLLEQNAAHCLTVPMQPGARSLNLAVAVGAAVFEARRQFAAQEAL
jgi:tRNA (cytidine/uridine-2'-O-)-methyltransferase